MDIYCLNCGEPFEVTEVYDDPTGFEFGASRGQIKSCPCCHGKKEAAVTDPKQKARLNNIALMAELLGDDVDGLASMIDDFDYVGLLDE